MPYVIHDQDGNITRASAQSIVGSDYISFEDPDLIAFLQSNEQDPSKIGDALAELQRTDIDMSRIIEDVVRALLKKNILRMNDLPKAVQDKLAYRINLRVKIDETLSKATQSKQQKAQQDNLDETKWNNL